MRPTQDDLTRVRDALLVSMTEEESPPLPPPPAASPDGGRGAATQLSAAATLRLSGGEGPAGVQTPERAVDASARDAEGGVEEEEDEVMMVAWGGKGADGGASRVPAPAPGVHEARVAGLPSYHRADQESPPPADTTRAGTQGTQRLSTLGASARGSVGVAAVLQVAALREEESEKSDVDEADAAGPGGGGTKPETLSSPAARGGVEEQRGGAASGRGISARLFHGGGGELRQDGVGENAGSRVDSDAAVGEVGDGDDLEGDLPLAVSLDLCIVRPLLAQYHQVLSRVLTGGLPPPVCSPLSAHRTPAHTCFLLACSLPPLP